MSLLLSKLNIFEIEVTLLIGHFIVWVSRSIINHGNDSHKLCIRKEIPARILKLKSLVQNFNILLLLVF